MEKERTKKTTNWLTHAPPPAHAQNSQVPHHRRAPHLHGHDGLLQDVCAAAHAPAAEHDEVRSSRYVDQSHESFFFVFKQKLRWEPERDGKIKKKAGGFGFVGEGQFSGGAATYYSEETLGWKCC